MKLFSHTKKLSGALLLLALSATNSFSQAISAYTFATGTGGSIATLSSPTSLIPSGVDDAATAVISFAGNFSFMFGGIAYTQFSVSSNGVLNFGSMACPATYANTLASVGTNIKVTPFWDDIITTGDGVRYQLTGTAPNRSFIIIWNGVDYTTAAAVQFQLTLFETTNVIRFDYGAGSGGTANIGIYNSTTEFESVKVSTNSMSTSSAQNSVAWPGAGRYYTFTPPVTVPTVTSFTPTSGCATVANVAITGTNFGGVTSVKFGGVNAQSFSIISSTSISAIPSSGTTGKVTVTNSAGTGTSSGNFTINLIPTIGATATPSANVCSGSSVTLSGTGASTYSWSDGVSNAVSFTPTTTTTYTVTGTSASGCTSTGTITVNYTQSPTTSNAGPDQTVCGTSISLAANSPAVGTGTWSIISGTGGIINNTASALSSFTGVVGNTYSLRWAITNLTCAASADTIVVALKQNPTVANAGPDQSVCGTSTSLAANISGIGTGTWSIVSGTGGAINNTSSPSSGFTGIAGNSYSLKWSIANSPCSASVDTVVINFTANPTTSNAGADQTICGTSATLAANTPSVGTGTWSIISGTGGTISNASSPISNFTGVAGNSYLLKWSIANSPCNVSADTVAINFIANPSIANAGEDQTICGTSATLTASTPTVGMGSWNIISGIGGTISIASSPSSSFTGVAGNSYVLVWTISNSPCLSSTDTVSITLISDPTIANAGADQSICGISAMLSANAPVIGTGSWSIVNGNGGTIVDPSNPVSDFTGSGGVTYTLRWSISNSPCNVSTDDMIIKFFNAPTANAGSDQPVCSNSYVTLNGSIGGSSTAAAWTTSGNGTFSPGASNLNATYTPGSSDIASENATLTLTTNNPSGVCIAATSQVNISINGLSYVNAGADREVCVTDTVQLNGQLNGAVVPVLWTTTGDGMFDNNTSLQTIYRPGAADAASGWVTCILSTQPSSNVCSLVSDTVVFKVRASVPPQPSAITGAPTSVCPPLNGINLSTDNNSLATTYSWDISPGSNGITFVGSSTTNSQVVNLATTTNSGYNMRVTAYNACGASPYRTVYIRRATSVPASVMGSIVACAGNSKTYTTYDVTGASTYKWTSTGGILLNGSTTPKIVPDTTIIATFPTTFNTGTICVSSQVACFTSATKCTTVSKSSPVLNSLSGAANVCPGSVQTYKVPVTAGAASYTWTLPANVTGSSNNDSISVSIGQNYTTGSICVKATNVCGVTTAAKCQQVTSGVPARPASITGPLAGVCGQTVTYTAPANSSTSFMWTVPVGAVINGPNNGNSINVTMPSPFNAAVVSVVAVNSCGNSLARSITVKGAPAQPAAITSNPSSFIANTQGVLFTTDSNTIMPGSNLLWTYPSTCTLVRGQGTTGLMLNWGSANGTVSLKASNACGNATRTFAVALASLRSANDNSTDSTINSISEAIIRTTQNNNLEKGLNLQAYPDMEQKILTFTFYAATPGEYTYSLLDESNREVRDGVIDAQEGVNMQEVEMNSLPANVVYRLKIKNSAIETHINVTMK